MILSEHQALLWDKGRLADADQQHVKTLPNQRLAAITVETYQNHRLQNRQAYIYSNSRVPKIN
jgi:hypothetical protein